MYVSTICLDQYGSRSDQRLGQLSNGLNVICGSSGSGKSNLVNFFRGMWCGFHGQGRKSDRTSNTAQRGELVVQTECGAQTIRRREHGTGEKLTIENADGGILGNDLKDFHGDVPTPLLRLAYFVNFSTQPSLTELLNAAKGFGCRIAGGSDLVDERTETEQLLTAKRNQLAKLLAEPTPLETLHGDKTDPQVSPEVAVLQSRESDLRQELASLDARWAELDRQRRNGERPFKTAVAQPDELGSKIRAIDAQLARWNRMLKDIVARKHRAAERADHRQQCVMIPAANVTPRRHVVALQRRIEESQKALQQLAGAKTPCTCLQLQATFAEVLDAMLDDVGQLSNDLSCWQSYHLYRQAAGERDQLARCELELRQTIQTLKDRREALIGRHRSQQSRNAQSHVSEVTRADGHEGSQPTDSNHTELNAELVRIDSLRHKTRRELHDLACELQQLLGRRNESDALTIKSHNAETSHHQLQSEIAQLEARCKQLRTESTIASFIETASSAVRRLSSSKWVHLECNSVEDVWVHDRQGRRVRFSDLDAGSRDQVYLAFCLAIVTECDRHGARCPMMLNGAFTHYPARDVRDALEFLRDFARDRQVLCLTQYEHMVGLARMLNIPVHQLPQSATAERARQSSPDEVLQRANLALQENESTDSVEPYSNQSRYRVLEKGSDKNARQVRVNLRESKPLNSSTDDDNSAPQPGGASEFHLSEYDPIERAPWIDQANANRLRRIGILRVGDLLRVPVGEITADLQQWGITGEMVESWQAQIRLMCHVRGLRSYDARILVACGIRSPGELMKMNSHTLRKLVRDFSATPEGQAILSNGTESELSRVTEWIRVPQVHKERPGAGTQGKLVSKSTSARKAKKSKAA